MRLRLSVLALALSCLGLGASLASLVDYLAPVPTFCAASGCETVRASAWAYPLGIPMPVFGVLFFAVMIVLALVARPKLRLVLALGGAAWALLLVGVQAFAIGAFCKLCMIADSSATLLAISILLGAQTVRLTAARVMLGASLADVLPLGFAIATAPSADPAPAVATSTAPQAVPDVVTRAQHAGAVTIVEFVDFECPFCRRLAPELANAVAHATGTVDVVRKMVPLPMHPHSRTAALAWCCADAQGKGDEMAAALFSAPPDELTPQGCEKLAASVGCDLDKYRSTLADPATAARVEADSADAKSADANALPTIFVGEQRFTGANHSAAELLAAIEHAH